MDRREFIKRALYYGTAVTASIFIPGLSKLNPLNKIWAKSSSKDLVAVKGSTPAKMFDKGIKVLGGISKFVKKGQTVVIKPNIGWDVVPELGANTNPDLIGRIVEHCKLAGAKKIWVFDHTCNNWKKSYKNSGIQRAVNLNGGKMVPAHKESYYHSVTIPNSKTLKKAKVHELVLDSDVFINVPVLKDHSGANLTIAMKNLMGVVWNRRYYHWNGLHECISEFPLYRKPDLNIVDAYNVMIQNGPRGISKEDLVLMKTQLISEDIVAVDTAAAKVFGRKIGDIDYISLAHKMKIGNKNLEQLNIKRITM